MSCTQPQSPRGQLRHAYFALARAKLAVDNRAPKAAAALLDRGMGYFLDGCRLQEEAGIDAGEEFVPEAMMDQLIELHRLLWEKVDRLASGRRIADLLPHSRLVNPAVRLRPK